MLLKHIFESYHGDHRAPNKEGDSPAHDLEDTFPDIYTDDGYKFYGDHGDPAAIECITILKNIKGRPNVRIKVYRAVPIIEDRKYHLRTIYDHKRYVLKHGKLPREQLYGRSFSETYEYYDFLDEEEKRLESMPDEPVKQYKINPGDWVTLSRKYAVEHGRSNLNNKYRVVSKTVLAKQVFFSDDVREAGYDP